MGLEKNINSLNHESKYVFSKLLVTQKDTSLITLFHVLTLNNEKYFVILKSIHLVLGFANILPRPVA